jgi:integral membrane protein
LNLRNAIVRLRLIGFLEAVSWFFLLFIAMPLKYFADKPLMVKYVGWIHGVLFMIYISQLVTIWLARKWKFNMLGKGLLGAFLPFGTLVFDRYLMTHRPERFSKP